MRMNFIQQKEFYHVNKCKMNYDIEVDNMERKSLTMPNEDEICFSYLDRVILQRLSGLFMLT